MKKLQSSNERLLKVVSEQQAILDNDMIAMFKLRDRHIVWANRAMDRIFGFEAGELIGQPFRILHFDDETYCAFTEAADPELDAGGSYRTQLRMVRNGGTQVWIDAGGTLIAPETDESLWVLVDITSSKREHERIEHIAYHDALTGLPNRQLMGDRLTQSLARAERTGRPLALCYLDLDGFKPINDRHGHAAGDDLLRQVAERLLSCVRLNDTVCRLGGDEFVLILTDIADIHECESIVRRILGEINTPFALRDNVGVQVSASVGVALFPNGSGDHDLLIRQADHAMYQAKLLGRNRFAHFSRGPARLDNCLTG